jgi:transposase
LSRTITCMEITPQQFTTIEHCLPRQRGNVSLSNLQVINAILYVAEHGCKWRGLPKRFGNWHTIYTRMRRWTKAGVFDRDVRGVAARTGCAHQDRGCLAGLHEHQGPSRWHGGVKKNGPQSIGKSRGGWNTKIHMVAADARTAVTFCLSPGQAHDAPEGRRLLNSLGATSRPVHC